MANSELDPEQTNGEIQFTINLSDIELTDEEFNTFQNQITKLAMEYVQKASDATAQRRHRGPYVKIIFVKAIHR